MRTMTRASLLLLVLLAGCTGNGGASTPLPPLVDNMSTVPPAWARDPVGQWLNMDWDLWSCPQAHKCCPWRAGGECQ